MWGSGIRILGIDGGAENESACDSDDNDFDNDSDEEDDDNEANITPTESQKESFIVQEACTDDATQIADDLKSIFKHDLADSTIKETLEQQQHFLYKRLPSSTIPMYKQDECVKAEKSTMTLQKKWIARNSINLLKLKQTITKPFSFVKPQLFGYSKRVSVFPLIVYLGSDVNSHMHLRVHLPLVSLKMLNQLL